VTGSFEEVVGVWVWGEGGGGVPETHGASLGGHRGVTRISKKAVVVAGHTLGWLLVRGYVVLSHSPSVPMARCP
jgi:hypothetical protein